VPQLEAGIGSLSTRTSVRNLQERTAVWLDPNAPSENEPEQCEATRAVEP